MDFAKQVIDYHMNIDPSWKLPRGFDLIFPFGNTETRRVFQSFYNQYFSDNHERIFLFGINPGRFGAGITGIPFTDPKILEEICGIDNSFPKRNELSAIFIYEMIDALGGPEVFYSKFYITSLCHLGFIKEGKNINYYDDKELEKGVLSKIVENISTQIQFGANLKMAYSIGQGKNFKFFKKVNDQHGFFGEVKPLPHPRWVMQYRRKSLNKYIDVYIDELSLYQ